MKPAVFDYQAPATVAEAVRLLGEADDARLLAGGQSLMPLLAMRLSQPATLVDLNGITELDYIRRDNGHLAIGAMTRQRTAERDPLARQTAPALVEALGHVGHVTIRNRGTVGGSVAHADPAAELPATMLALDAQIVVTGPAGQRAIPAAEFFRSYFTTAIEPGEILTEIRLPVAPSNSGWAFEELARRNGDFAIVAVIAGITLQDGVISASRVAVAGAGPTPVRAGDAEALLTGQSLADGNGQSADLLAAASAATAAAIDPVDDIHGTVAYRRRITAVLTRRALTRAIHRAEEQTR